MFSHDAVLVNVNRRMENYTFERLSTIPASGNRKSCLGPVFPTIYEFGPIQFSDVLMSDGYFQIFLKKE